jgi:hypothetical protein
LSATFEAFFETKTAGDVEGTMSFFSPSLVTYIDATLGWDLDGYETLKGVFSQYMPNWSPPARSYTTGVFSNESSALVYMVDTPELFGGELRILGAVDFVDGKIVRWIDYWDASSFDAALYARLRTPADTFPRDLKDRLVPTQAASELVAAAAALHDAFSSADAGAAVALMHTDVVLEDRSLRTQVLGRIEAARYLNRVLADVPYGRSSRLRHVVGGSSGGGFEWTAGPDVGELVGITAVEIDAHGLVTKITSVYDSRRLAADAKTALVAASVPA